MNKLLKNLVLVVTAFLLGTAVASAQGTVRISGQITDASTGEPVIGAAVMVQGTNNGSVTDIDGNYTLSAGSGVTVVVSSIGYDDVTFKVSAGKAKYNMQLSPSAETLDDVVVVAYGSVKKANLTGAVDQIDSEKFTGRPVSNTTQMLQGAVANLNISLADGKPGRTADYNIRGTTSIGGGGSALVLIDGVEGDPALLNPNDIESVSVLKDAASSAVYGSRAPYGVVLITTKDPSKNKDKMSINYSFNMALQEPTAVPDVVTDGFVYATMFHDSIYGFNHTEPTGINKTQPFSTLWLETFRQRKLAGNTIPTTVDQDGKFVYYADTDWYDLVYKDVVTSRTHNLSISGQSGKVSYYVSGRAYDYDGLFNYDPDVYSTKNLRGKAKVQVLPWLSVSENMEFTHEKYHIPSGSNQSSDGNIWRAIDMEGHPSAPAFNPDGTLTMAGAYVIGGFYSKNNYTNRTTVNFKTTTTLKAEFLNKRLSAQADFTYLFRNKEELRKRTAIPYSNKMGETIYLGTVFDGEYMRNYDSKRDYLSTNAFVQYEDTIAKKHYIKALAGFNYEQQATKGLYVTRYGLLNPDTDVFNFAIGDEIITQSIGTKWRVAGFFGRLNYAYDDRYLVELNGRYDGSSKFPLNSQWGFFPSGSGAWRVSKEHWWHVNPKAMSDLKVRASYGVLGNGSVDPYAYQEKFVFSTASNMVLDGSTNIRYTSVPNTVPKSLTWETSKTFDVGLDLSFLNGKIELNADYYIRRTLNMFTVGPALAATFGVSSPKGNYADMSTYGWEAVLGYGDSFRVGGRQLGVKFKATISDYQAYIDKYYNPTRSIGGSKEQGRSYYNGSRVGDIWGFEINRLFQSQDEIDNYYGEGVPYVNRLTMFSSDYNMRPGDPCIEDLNKNGKIDVGANTVDDPGDRKIIGNSTPRYQYSFSLNLDYAGFYASVFFRGIGHQDWYPSNEGMFWGQYTRPYSQAYKWMIGNIWSENNRDAYLPRYAGYHHLYYVGWANTRYIQNIAYIRLQNVQFGYSLPKNLLKKAHLSDIRVYFSGENLWTWSPLYKLTTDFDVVTANKASDTDISSSSIADGYNYPSMRTFSFGISITY